MAKHRKMMSCSERCTSSRPRARALALLLSAHALMLRPGEAHAEPATATAPEAAGDVALAERYAAEAFAAYRGHEYGHALVLYHQALAAAPSADIAYNIARVYDLGLKDRRQAIHWYERYRSDPAAVANRVEAATRRIAELTAAEQASLASAADVDAIAREFPLDAERDAADASAAAAARDGLSPLRLAALTVGSVGVVSLGLGVGFGLSARAKTDDWKQDCDGNACSSQRGVDAAETAARRANISTIGLGVGGGLLALGALLWLVDRDPEQPADSSARLRLAPAATGSRLAGVVSGRF
jgi:hypothetical protein